MKKLLALAGGAVIVVTATVLPKNLRLYTSAFPNNRSIPQKYTCQGDNINPPFSFSGIPDKAMSLVLTVDDPDAPGGTFAHWVVYNIPVQTKLVKGNSVPAGADSGLNGNGNTKYTGPCPPSGTHHYHFKLYAVDTILRFDSPPSESQLVDKLQGHIIVLAELVGLYTKK